MRTTKKITSIVLAVLMVVSMMSVLAVSASAATLEASSQAELIAAIDSAATKDTIKITDDFTLDQVVTFPAGKTLYLDLNGHTLTCTVHKGIVNNGTLHIQDDTDYGCIMGDVGLVLNNKTLYIDGGYYWATMADHSKCAFYNAGSTDSTAYMYVNGGVIMSDGNGIWTYGKSYVYVNDPAEVDSVYASAITGNGLSKYAGYTININGGSVSSLSDTAIYHPNTGTLNIKGGKVQGATAVYTKAGTTNITGGLLKGTGAAADYSYNGSGSNPTGDAFVVDNCDYPGNSPKVTISGGEFVSKHADAVASYVKQDDPNYTGAAQERIENFITGGNFSGTVSTDLYDTNYYKVEDNGDGTVNVVTRDDLTAVWEWVDSTSAAYRYQAKLTLKDGDTVVYENVYAPTIKVVGDDFNYTCPAKKVNGVSYGPIADKLVEADGVIMTSAELTQAVKNAGNWKLGNDMTVSTFTVYDGFKLDGQGHTLTSNNQVLPGYYMFQSKDANTKFELSNITLDGNNGRAGAVSAYTGSSSNSGNVITLNNVTIKNFKSNNYVGAVYAFGSSKVNLNDCTVTDNTVKAKDADEAANTGSSVWAGAKATVNINGGTYDEVLLHGGTANATVDGGATVDTIRFGFTKKTEDSTKMQAVINDATVNSVEKYTDFTPENVVMDPAQATVTAPEGYMWDDSVEPGMKTLVSDNPLNPLEVAATDINDGNDFGINSNYLKGTLLGVQKKSQVEAVTSEDGAQETGNDLRFVAVIDTDLVQDADVTDYGFVLAKVEDTKTTANTNFDGLQVGRGAGEKYISAKGTYNTVCGTTEEALKYGDPEDTTTEYKYVTCAVNGVDTTSKIAIRFYVTKGGKTYYAKYAGNNYNFTGCTAGINASGDVY